MCKTGFTLMINCFILALKNGWAMARSLTQQDFWYESGNDDQTLLNSLILLYWLHIIRIPSFHVTIHYHLHCAQSLFVFWVAMLRCVNHSWIHIPLRRCNGFNKSLEKLSMMLTHSVENCQNSLIFIKSFLAIFVSFGQFWKKYSGNTFWPMK